MRRVISFIKSEISRLFIGSNPDVGSSHNRIFESRITERAFLFKGALIFALGVALNRMNVFLIAYDAPFGVQYYPSVTETVMVIGFFATMFILFKLGIMIFPVMPKKQSTPRPGSGQAEDSGQ